MPTICLDAARRWKELFDPAERSKLTRAKVRPEEWLGVAEAAGKWSASYIVEAARRQIAPDIAQAIAEVCGARIANLHSDVVELGADAIRRVPESLRPAPAGAVLSMPDNIDLDRLAALGAHVPEYLKAERIARAVAYLEAGMTQQIVDATGSGIDWDRAWHCRTVGIDDDDAVAWAPHFPGVFQPLIVAGWTPADVAGLTPTEGGFCAAWARNGFGPGDKAAWVAAGITDTDTAERYRDAGISPDAAALWERLAVHPNDADGVLELIEAGVSIGDTRQLDGLRIIRGVSELLAVCTVPEIAAWLTMLDAGRPVPPNAIINWRNAIADPAQAAPWRKLIRDRNLDGPTGLTSPELAFIASTIDAETAAASNRHPLVTAVAADLGIDPAKLNAQAAISAAHRSAMTVGQSARHACIVAYNRRRRPVPWQTIGALSGS